jgi:hypothetical protein
MQNIKTNDAWVTAPTGNLWVYIGGETLAVYPHRDGFTFCFRGKGGKADFGGVYKTADHAQQAAESAARLKFPDVAFIRPAEGYSPFTGTSAASLDGMFDEI